MAAAPLYQESGDEDDIPLEQGDVWPGAGGGLHPGPALDNYKPTNFTASHSQPADISILPHSGRGMSPVPGMRCPASWDPGTRGVPHMGIKRETEEDKGTPGTVEP